MNDRLDTRWQRFDEWRKTIAWSRAVSYVVIIATLAYVINDIYGIIDTPATNEVRKEITKKGVVNEQEVKAIVRDEVERILAAEGLTEDPRGSGDSSSGPSPDAIVNGNSAGGGGSSTGSAPPSTTSPPSNEGGGNGGGPGGSPPGPQGPPGQPGPPGETPDLPNLVPNVVQEVCDTLPQVHLPPVCD
jgi:hypothetical protein